MECTNGSSVVVAFGGLLDFVDQLQSIHLRHMEVDESEGIIGFGQATHRFSRVAECIEADSPMLKPPSQDKAGDGIIVHNEHFSRRLFSGGLNDAIVEDVHFGLGTIP